MAGNAKNIRLGPCRVIWGVEDLGFTKGGVEVSITSTQVSITSDQFGETPMDKYVTSRTVNVKVPLIETIPGKLDLILNGGDGTAELATVQTVAGLSMRNASQSLVLHPLSKADDDYSEDFVVIRAGVIPNIEATYDSDNERVWSVTFTSFPYYGEFGDIMEADRSGVVVYGGRSAVVANGGLYRASQRSTIGTYFDKNGVMQTADAYVTRPNYVYQNGVWKQKGWLLEPQATNSNPNNSSALMINAETCTALTDGRLGFTCNLQPKGVNDDPIQVAGTDSSILNSIFVQADFTQVTVTNNYGISYIEYGENLRRYYYHGYFQPLYWNQTSNPVSVTVFDPQSEAPTTSGAPSSFIPQTLSSTGAPQSVTRAAD